MKQILVAALAGLLAGCSLGPPHPLHNVKRFHVSLKDVEPIKEVAHIERPSGPGEIRVTPNNRTVVIDQQDEVEELQMHWWELSEDDY